MLTQREHMVTGIGQHQTICRTKIATRNGKSIRKITKNS
jgi:hypothetical protein